MRALIQRVQWGKVAVEGVIIGEIGPGVVTFLGVGSEDSEKSAEKMIEKIAKLRIFEDEQGKMNLSMLERGLSHLIISQFTLYGDTSKGNRPSFIGAGSPELAKALYEKAIAHSKSIGLKTEHGQFQADMKVSLLNDGPVTLWIEND